MSPTLQPYQPHPFLPLSDVWAMTSAGHKWQNFAVCVMGLEENSGYHHAMSIWHTTLAGWVRHQKWIALGISAPKSGKITGKVWKRYGRDQATSSHSVYLQVLSMGWIENSKGVASRWCQHEFLRQFTLVLRGKNCGSLPLHLGAGGSWWVFSLLSLEHLEPIDFFLVAFHPQFSWDPFQSHLSLWHITSWSSPSRSIGSCWGYHCREFRYHQFGQSGCSMDCGDLVGSGHGDSNGTFVHGWNRLGRGPGKWWAGELAPRTR